MAWIRRTIWFEDDRYEAAKDADPYHVASEAAAVAADVGEPITVHVGGYALEVEPDADPALLREKLDKAAKPKKAKPKKKAAKPKAKAKPKAAKKVASAEKPKAK